MYLKQDIANKIILRQKIHLKISYMNAKINNYVWTSPTKVVKVSKGDSQAKGDASGSKEKTVTKGVLWVITSGHAVIVTPWTSQSGISKQRPLGPNQSLRQANHTVEMGIHNSDIGHLGGW